MRQGFSKGNSKHQLGEPINLASYRLETLCDRKAGTMKEHKLIAFSALAILMILTGGAQPQLHDEEAVKAWGKGVSKEIIAGLVANRTWHVNWSSCMGATDCSTYWDFSEDGTVCARGIGATPQDKCHDDGKWRIKENSLCWELTWLGGGDGYKSTWRAH